MSLGFSTVPGSLSEVSLLSAYLWSCGFTPICQAIINSSLTIPLVNSEYSRAEIPPATKQELSARWSGSIPLSLSLNHTVSGVSDTALHEVYLRVLVTKHRRLGKTTTWQASL